MINGKVIAIFVKCAKFVTEKKKEKEEKKDKPQFYSFRCVNFKFGKVIIKFSLEGKQTCFLTLVG